MASETCATTVAKRPRLVHIEADEGLEDRADELADEWFTKHVTEMRHERQQQFEQQDTEHTGPKQSRGKRELNKLRRGRPSAVQQASKHEVDDEVVEAHPDDARPTVDIDPAAVQVKDLVEDAHGYLYLPGRKKPAGKIASWGLGLSEQVKITGARMISCNIHGAGCKRIFSEADLCKHGVDGKDELKRWLLKGFALDKAAHISEPRPWD